MIPKFRFYHLTENKMYEVNSVRMCQKQVECLPKGCRFSFITFEEEEGILMQSTGLIDKNGTEIFEGDIVKVQAEDTEPKMRADRYEIGVIIYSYGSFDIETKPNTVSGLIPESNLTDIRLTLEVIGNQFEHPHLLEE